MGAIGQGGRFIDHLLDELGSAVVPSAAGPGSIDLVGWLELTLDETPVVIVTSLCEGFVPESINADPLLPGSLRALLALNDNELRLARDAYLLTTLVQSRGNRLWLMVPRHNADGEPLMPSRLLFAGLSGELLAQRILGLTEPIPADSTSGALDQSPTLQAPLPRREPRATLELPVTAFRDYGQSPRLFYFRHILRLDTVEIDPKEMSPLLFGNLLHEVLSLFGQSAIHRSPQLATLQTWLTDCLQNQAKIHFAGLSGPAVRFQLAELEQRLMTFAEKHHQQTGLGWEILYAERKTSDDVLRTTFDLRDGRTLTVKGRIDRVDWHPETGAWRIVDYKSSQKATPPLKTHLSEKLGWKDFQLPLYSELVRSLLPRLNLDLISQSQPPALHYFQIPHQEEDCGLSQCFPAEQVDSCLDRAREIGPLDPGRRLQRYGKNRNR